ncbi:MAG: ATP-binding protein [Thermodesulfovibrionales bacterium]|nr:ATP-binding protein [Thermodesulfovibrionales bacterium]
MSILTAFVIKTVVAKSMRIEVLALGESIAFNLSDKVSELLLYEDYYNVSEVINDIIKQDRDIRYIFVTDLNGKLFAHTFKDSYPIDILQWNPITADSMKSVKLLETEEGRITDIAVKIFAGMPSELHIGIKEDKILNILSKITNYMIFLTVTIIVVGTVLSVFLSRMIVKPLENLKRFTDELSKGEFGKQINIKSKDEVGSLAATFNNLSKELLLYKQRTEESYKQMIKTEKLTALGRLSGGLAHEIKNPLMPIKTLFQTYKDNPRLTMQDIEIVLSSVEQIDNLINKFLSFTRSDEINYSEIYLNAIIKEILQLTDIQIKDQNINLILKLSKIPAVSGDRPILKQAIFNIIVNAIEAMPKGGDLTIKTYKNRDFVYLSITDTGEGIPLDVQDKIFDPFFTTKTDGTGLGLSIAHNIIQLHSGQIHCDSSEKGSKFTIILPLQKVFNKNGNHFDS